MKVFVVIIFTCYQTYKVTNIICVWGFFIFCDKYFNFYASITSCYVSDVIIFKDVLIFHENNCLKKLTYTNMENVLLPTSLGIHLGFIHCNIKANNTIY